MDKVSPLSSHLTSHTAYAFLVDFGFGSTAALFFFFFTLKDNPPHGPRPSSLALRFFLFLLHCIGPVWAPLAFRRAFLHPSPAMLSRSLVFSALLCSPTSLIPKPAMFEPTHPPTIGRREKACGPKACGHEHGALFCFICFTFFWGFFLLEPCFISPHFAKGSDSGA